MRVERDGHMLAESDAPILVYETGLPHPLLPPATRRQRTAPGERPADRLPIHKGFASSHDVVIDDRRHPDLFWSYQKPFPDVADINGYRAPHNERLDLVVDGELHERPAGPLCSSR